MRQKMTRGGKENMNVRCIALILMVSAMFILPVMADSSHVNVYNDFDPVNNVHNDFSPMNDVDVSVAAPTVNVAAPTVNVAAPTVNVDVDNTNTNTNTNINTNTNRNTNVNINVNDLDQSQRQNQNQAQVQFQFQQQQQKQNQKQAQNQQQGIYQPITIIMPKDVKIDQLDVGDAQLYTRLVYPQEVITFPISGGDVINMISGGPVAVYTIASTARDEKVAIESSDAIPKYDPIYHKMVFGMVVPLDKINYYTTKVSMVASSGAAYLVVDNRGDGRPAPGFTMVEVTTVPCNGCVEPTPNFEPREQIGEIAPYPVDASGRAITT